MVDAYNGKHSVGLATLIDKQNSIPEQKIYFDSSGNPSGSFNNKKIDEQVHNTILDLIPYGKSKMIDIDENTGRAEAIERLDRIIEYHER